MITMTEVFWAFVLMSVLLLLGKYVRSYVRVFQAFYLPSSIIAGLVALSLGPEVLGRILSLISSGEGAWWENGFFPEPMLEVWGRIPGLLISVVFAALFIGKPIAPPREIWRDAGPMVIHGQIIAWGQYVVGLLLFLLVLGPVWGLNPMSGALIEISFEGGHGTAAGLADTFRELGFEDGADLALGLATIGVVAGVLLGTVLVNWAIRRGHLKKPGSSDELQEELSEHDERELIEARKTGSEHMIDPLSIHLGYIGLAIGLGWLLHKGLMIIERFTWMAAGGPELMRHIPLFPLAMIGGVLIQIVLDRTGRASKIDRQLVNRVSGTALDLLIVSAMATLSLAAIGAHIGPFVLLALAGIAWNLVMFIWLAPRIFEKHWVPYGLANFGQCMGMTVIGLLLIRMTDPDNRTGAMHSFGYKQLLFEPVVGGGLFTAASLPLIAQFGPVPVLLFTAIVMTGWGVMGYLKFRKR